MAERSKAPDSRTDSFLVERDFWSPNGGVGSNPTSDIGFTSTFKETEMAERSKAPDSRTDSFLVNGISGLQMEAWRGYERAERRACELRVGCPMSGVTRVYIHTSHRHPHGGGGGGGASGNPAAAHTSVFFSEATFSRDKEEVTGEPGLCPRINPVICVKPGQRQSCVAMRESGLQACVNWLFLLDEASV
ncbi:unnamed protein product [Pleuronectes platessa]|uniref:Uncharacterized protein n=1 Tax=Pleuronectes platessa TaxID=8262 RepID=A0A9N7TV12_PLEPL|nr:unnamed protein product [Pleuronectes platessa]